MRKRVIGVIFILIFVIASVIYMAGGFRAPRSVSAEFSLDRRAEIELVAGGVEIEFSPEVAGDYDIALFPGEGCSVTQAILRGEGGVISEGTYKMSAELYEGENYTLIVRGSGVCVAEVMRRSPGRSIAKPALIAEGTSGSIIAREGNAGWFKFTGTGEHTTVYAIPGAGFGLDIEAVVYDGNGIVKAGGISLENGACAAYFEAEDGANYYLRISSPAGGKGMYDIGIIASGDADLAELDFATGDIEMLVGDMRAARAMIEPENAHNGLVWFSSDSAVASVSQEGYITANAPGEADITAYGYNGISHSIKISVQAVEPQDMVFTDEEFVVNMGMSARPRLRVYPMAAAAADIVYESRDPEIAAVSESGEVVGISMGETVICAKWGDISAELHVRVEEALLKRRALIIGQQMYAPEVNTVRTGSANTVSNMEALLGTAMFENGLGCDVRVELDPSKDEIIAAISDTFSGAGNDDVSILYITCHGDYQDGNSVLQFCDGSEMTAMELEMKLRKIPGVVVIMIDCCDSGGFVGTYEELSAFTGGVMAAFSGGQAPFGGSKYKVLASAGLGQDSYRIGYGDGEGQAATVFARALCDGLGWDMDAQVRSALNADSDHDGSIILWETYLYASRRVRWYLDMADGGTGACMQDVQVYPEGDMFVLFER